MQKRFSHRAEGKAHLSLSSLQLSWDSYPAHGFAIQDLDIHKIEKFIAKVNAVGRFRLEGTAYVTNTYQAYARNKLIAEAFYLTGDIEKYGSGFRRIRNEIDNYPTMDFVCEEVPNGFLATLSYVQQRISTKPFETEADFSNNKSNVTENYTEIV